jgi:hypothetical protein
VLNGDHGGEAGMEAGTQLHELLTNGASAGEGSDIQYRHGGPRSVVQGGTQPYASTGMERHFAPKLGPTVPQPSPRKKRLGTVGRQTLPSSEQFKNLQ